LLLIPVLAMRLGAHQPHDPISVVAVSPNFQNDQTIIASTNSLSVSFGIFAVLLSTNGGGSWTPMGGLPSQQWRSIQFSPNYANDKTVIAAGDGGLFETTNSGMTWAAYPVAPGAGFRSVAFSPNYVNDGLVYAVTTKTIWRSTNHASSFSQVNSAGPLTGNLTSVVISPNYAADKSVALGGASDGIFKTTNGGSSWAQVATGTMIPNVYQVAFSPVYKTDMTIFAASFGSGLFLSTSGGSSWAASNSGLTDLNITSLATYPNYSTSGTMAITAATAGVFISTNHGQTWAGTAPVARALAPSCEIATHFNQVVVHASGATGLTMFIGMYEGLWYSANQGESWTYSQTIPPWLIRTFQISPNFAVDQTIFANSYGSGPMISTNGGAAWTMLDTGFTNAFPDGSAISPGFATDRTIFSGVFTGLEQTTTAGAAWVTLPGINFPTYVRGLGISPGFATDQTLLIGTDNVCFDPPPSWGAWLSTNAGQSWISTNLTSATVASMTLSPGFPTDGTAFAGTDDFGLYVTHNGGVSWSSSLNLGADVNNTNVGISPAFPTDQTVFVGSRYSGIYKSTNGGATWSQLPMTEGITAMSFALSPNYLNDQTLWVGTLQMGLLESTNGGMNFTPLTAGPSFLIAMAISPNYVEDGTLFGASYYGIYKSTNAGVNWTFLGAPSQTDDTLNFITIFTGQWQQITDPLAALGTYTENIGAGNATLNFVGSGFQWIGQMGPQWTGGATVSVDGVQLAKVGEKASAVAEQKVIYQTDGLTCGVQHKLEIATGSTSLINIDSIIVLHDQCASDHAGH